jgi:hypothetical protein
MKQEHEMTPGVLVSGEVLSAGDARARVAVLEAELAELRKRVCVPDGWRVVPVEPTEAMLQAADAADREYTDRSFGSGHPLVQQGPYDHWCAMLAATPAPVERVEQAACTGKNCGSTDPNLHSADCFAEHEQAIAPTAAQDNWISVAERMPPAGTKVLAFYRNSMGVSRRICAEYIGKHQRDAFDFDSDYGDTDYDEASDQYYWRVDNWDELTHLAVTEGEITHWRVMPAVPGLDARQSGGAKV